MFFASISDYNRQIVLSVEIVCRPVIMLFISFTSIKIDFLRIPLPWVLLICDIVQTSSISATTFSINIIIPFNVVTYKNTYIIYVLTFSIPII